MSAAIGQRLLRGTIRDTTTFSIKGRRVVVGPRPRVQSLGQDGTSPCSRISLRISEGRKGHGHIQYEVVLFALVSGTQHKINTTESPSSPPPHLGRCARPSSSATRCRCRASVLFLLHQRDGDGGPWNIFEVVDRRHRLVARPVVQEGPQVKQSFRRHPRSVDHGGRTARPKAPRPKA